jgi:polyisoprenoid-binding protein YceI
MNTDLDARPARPLSPLAPAARPRRRRWAALGLVTVIATAAFGVWWFVLRSDPPAPASLDQAVAGVSAPAGAAAAGVDGTWSIDGTITNAQGTGSYTGFRVNEVLTGIGSQTAVGRTPIVEGTLTVKGTTLTAATINARLSGLTTDDSRRDGAVQRALDTSRFPNATFVLTDPVDVGSVPVEGQRITAAATGDLTIHGVTHRVTLDLQAQLQNGVLVVVGSTDVAFSDYGVTAPTAPVVASVDDHGVIEVQLYFVKQG